MGSSPIPTGIKIQPWKAEETGQVRACPLTGVVGKLSQLVGKNPALSQPLGLTGSDFKLQITNLVSRNRKNTSI